MITKIQLEPSGIINTHGDIYLGPSFNGVFSGPYRARFECRLGVECPDMTAIAYAYTPEGFVVGADGLRVDARTHKDSTNDAQNIFPVFTLALFLQLP